MSSSDNLVLVTGAAGYIAAYVVKGLADAGFRVRGTVRDLKDEKKIGFLRQLVPSEQLELVEADLMDEQEIWDKAVKGCRYVAHVATPLADPRFVKDTMKVMITPALNGTKKVLEASKHHGVEIFIETSSIFACSHNFNEGRVTPENYNETSTPGNNAYGYMKIVTEKLAWEYDSEKMKVVSINPGFVVGPPLGGRFPSAIEPVLLDPLRGKPAPNAGLGFVDANDVAQAFVKVLRNKDAKGRYILVEKTLQVKDIIILLKTRYKEALKEAGLPVRKARKVLPFTVPNNLIWFLSKYAPRILTPQLGLRLKDRIWLCTLLDLRTTWDTTKAKDELGIEFSSVDRAIVETALWCVRNKYC